MVRFMAFFQSAKKKEEVRRMTMFVLFERA
jgi:hypothetical protein